MTGTKPSIVDTKQDFNKQFDIPKLLAMDRIELEKLIKLFPVYQRRYGPAFTEDTWSEVLMKFYEKAHTFSVEKSLSKYNKDGSKFFGWFNIVALNIFLLQENRKNFLKGKMQINYAEDTVINTEHLIADNYDSIEQKIGKEELIKTIKGYISKEEELIVDLYISNAKLTPAERKQLREIKKRVLLNIYTKDELKEFKEKGKGRCKSKKAQESVKFHKLYIEEGRNKMSKEKKKEFLRIKRDKRRQEKLEHLKATDIKAYKKKLKQIEMYDKDASDKNERRKKFQAKQREQLRKEQEEMRKKILEQTKKENKNATSL